MRLFKWLKPIVDPKMGKIVIHFTTHGCMAQIEEFDWIGVIDGIAFPPSCQGSMMYTVKIMKGTNPQQKKANIAPWYLREIGDQIFVAYD